MSANKIQHTDYNTWKIVNVMSSFIEVSSLVVNPVSVKSLNLASTLYKLMSASTFRFW